eukprot:TRINITY_DN3642_c0_g1_i3.p1 TRINITY_DN3642_c0_g1~~TRINITY_DN3642_c0_g1_i3.p1  ORF type:complete len:641 (+),score=116.08 TRINITY_DN3642_c0_g1_i3:632-2554(+)
MKYTGGTCGTFSSCDPTRGATCDMSTGDCICPSGTCAKFGACVAEESALAAPGAPAVSEVCLLDVGGSCLVWPCDSSKFAVCDSYGSCLCESGSCAVNGRCIPTPGGACMRNTGATCNVLSCDPSRGSYCSNDYKCICPVGTCAKYGACVPEGTEPAAPAVPQAKGPEEPCEENGKEQEHEVEYTEKMLKQLEKRMKEDKVSATEEEKKIIGGQLETLRNLEANLEAVEPVRDVEADAVADKHGDKRGKDKHGHKRGKDNTPGVARGEEDGPGGEHGEEDGPGIEHDEENSEHGEKENPGNTQLPRPVTHQPTELAPIEMNVDCKSREASGSFECCTRCSMLDSPTGWRAADDKIGEWLQLDISSEETVVGVVTQGCADSDDMVSSYTLKYSSDGVDWQDAAFSTALQGNTDRSTRQQSRIDDIRARYIRILPQEWQGHICMRAGVLISKQAIANEVARLEDADSLLHEDEHLAEEAIAFERELEEGDTNPAGVVTHAEGNTNAAGVVKHAEGAANAAEAVKHASDLLGRTANDKHLDRVKNYLKNAEHTLQASIKELLKEEKIPAAEIERLMKQLTPHAPRLPAQQNVNRNPRKQDKTEVDYIKVNRAQVEVYDSAAKLESARNKVVMRLGDVTKLSPT